MKIAKHVKKCLLPLPLLFCGTLTTAAELQAFTQHQANPKADNGTLAFMDLSDFSMKWLLVNKVYLIKNQVPIIVLHAKAIDIQKLNERFPGLLAGVAPEPLVLLPLLYKQLGVQYYPAVVEKGVVWQINPNDQR